MKKHFAQDVADPPAAPSEISSSSSASSHAESVASVDDQRDNAALNDPVQPVLSPIVQKLHQAYQNRDTVVPLPSITYEQPFVFHPESGLFICLEHQQAFHIRRLPAHCRKCVGHQFSQAYLAELLRDSNLSYRQEDSVAYLNGMDMANRIPFVKLLDKFKCDAPGCNVIGSESKLRKHKKSLSHDAPGIHSFSKCLAIGIYDRDHTYQQLYKVSTNQPLPNNRNEADAIREVEFALFTERSGLIP